MIKPTSDVMIERMVFTLVRRSQASITSYLHFGNGDLAKFLDREAFQRLAQQLANHYFHKSQGLAIYEQIVELYIAILVMAPVLQRIPLSMRFDWHRGHVVGFLRKNSSNRIGRFHAALRCVERRYQPDKLLANLAKLGVHDADMVAVLLDLYRRHAEGTALKDRLAHQIFDPIILMSDRQGFELRYGNKLLRLEKCLFAGAIDLRRESIDLLDFSIISAQHRHGRHLEIYVSEACLTEFRVRIDHIINSRSITEYKMLAIENRINDFAERTRSARSALNQIKELKIWLANKVRKLSGSNSAANKMPNLLMNQWLQRADAKLYLNRPNFFMDARCFDEKTYRSFFSPYREV